VAQTDRVDRSNSFATISVRAPEEIRNGGSTLAHCMGGLLSVRTPQGTHSDAIAPGDQTLKRPICADFSLIAPPPCADSGRDQSAARGALSADIFSLGGMTANSGGGQRTPSGA
jgi:hypothetical protein